MKCSNKMNLTTKKYIEIHGARVHNLKNISLNIPRNSFVVITGLSGSGKSSLAFDTLYAEGQRRYVESLSSYARQFLGKIHKPEVDKIAGIPPAIAIEQKVNTSNPRSTVGTATEIYDYIKLLYARIGKTFSPISGVEVTRHTVTHVVQDILAKAVGRYYITSPLLLKDLDFESRLELLMQQGFNRLLCKGEVVRIQDVLLQPDFAENCKHVFLLIDRVLPDESEKNRIADSVQTAFYEGEGTCVVWHEYEEKTTSVTYSNTFEADGILFEEPSVHMFSFNSPLGACPTCEGFGKIMGIDPNLVIPNKNLSVFDGAVACWSGEKMQKWKNKLLANAHHFDFPVHRPYADLTPEQQKLLWTGNEHFKGISAFFKMVEANLYKIQYRVLLSRYRGKTTCHVCNGKRLKPEAEYVKIAGTSISDLVDLPMYDLHTFFLNLHLSEHEQIIAKRVLVEITSRVSFLLNVGLGYLTINRLSNTLSGGESQRINLATSLGSSLVGSLYILDEPSIGLHARDTHLLIQVLKDLQKLGNTVIVVEHDEEIMRAADVIIDIGPHAGTNGGEVVFQGGIAEMNIAKKSITANYLLGDLQIDVPASRKKPSHFISLKGARENNLKNCNVDIPLGVFTAVTGVSGSGKSSLIHTIVYPAIQKALGERGGAIGDFDAITGVKNVLFSVEFVSQNPIGRSTRSNPATYSKAYEEIRKLFAEQKLAQLQGFKPSHFSFNIDGGRCEECLGEGIITVEMQFMADVELECETCNGKRFKDEVLEVEYRKKSIYDVLELTVDDAIQFFSEDAKSKTAQKIVEKLYPLQNVGLGYIKLGQPSSTLSGGESQRIKLASFIGNESKEKPCFFIFDEPTTGLHFHDIHVLLQAFDALIKNGHTVLVIEHNMDVIKCADWIIDMGPEGGDKGGNVMFSGTPEELITKKDLHTAQFLRSKLY